MLKRVCLLAFAIASPGLAFSVLSDRGANTKEGLLDFAKGPIPQAGQMAILRPPPEIATVSLAHPQKLVFGDGAVNLENFVPVSLIVPTDQATSLRSKSGFDAFKFTGLATNWEGLTAFDESAQNIVICNALRELPQQGSGDQLEALRTVLGSDLCALLPQTTPPFEKF